MKTIKIKTNNHFRSVFYLGNNRAQEHADHIFGAQYDNVRERYASEIRDLEMLERSEREHFEYMWKVQEAGFGEDWPEYEAMWRRQIEYATEQNL